MLDTDKLNQLIVATNDYVEELSRQQAVLVEAIRDCGIIMKQDDFHKKQMSKLQNGVDSINNAITSAGKLRALLQKKWRDSLRVVD